MYDLITFKLMDTPHNVDISLGTCMRQKRWVLLDPDGMKA